MADPTIVYLGSDEPYNVTVVSLNTYTQEPNPATFVRATMTHDASGTEHEIDSSIVVQDAPYKWHFPWDFTAPAGAAVSYPESWTARAWVREPDGDLLESIETLQVTYPQTDSWISLAEIAFETGVNVSVFDLRGAQRVVNKYARSWPPAKRATLEAQGDYGLAIIADLRDATMAQALYLHALATSQAAKPVVAAADLGLKVRQGANSIEVDLSGGRPADVAPAAWPLLRDLPKGQVAEIEVMGQLTAAGNPENGYYQDAIWARRTNEVDVALFDGVPISLRSGMKA